MIKDINGKQGVWFWFLAVRSAVQREPQTAPSENCPLLGSYVARGGNSLPTFRDNLSVPLSKVKIQSYILDPWRWNRQVVLERR
jgi:hypothetical protein